MFNITFIFHLYPFWSLRWCKDWSWDLVYFFYFCKYPASCLKVSYWVISLWNASLRYVLGLTSRCVRLFHWFACHFLQQDYTVNHILNTPHVICGLFLLSLLTTLHLWIPCCISSRFCFVLYLISPCDMLKSHHCNI